MPASEQGDLRPPDSPGISTASFSTSRVVCEERHFTPAFQSNIQPSLQEQFDRALLEQRFEDLPDIEDTMRSEHGGVQQQLVLVIKEKRWLQAAHIRDVISRSGEEQSDAISPSVKEQMPQPQRLPQCIKIEQQLTYAQTLQMTRPNLPHLPIKIEQSSSTQYGYSAGISEDTLRAAQMTHAYENPLMPSLSIRQEPSTDITVDMQAILMERFGVEIQLHDGVIAREH
jgi:hypothetical protein